jgi:hypothetical protein
VVRLEDDLPFPRFAHGPPPLHPKLPKRPAPVGEVVWRSLASTSGGKGLDADGDISGEFGDGRQDFPAVPEQDADVLEVLIGKIRWGRTETSMPFSANAPAYSGRPSLVSQSAISCIAARARLISALWTRWMGDFTR